MRFPGVRSWLCYVAASVMLATCMAETFHRLSTQHVPLRAAGGRQAPSLRVERKKCWLSDQSCVVAALRLQGGGNTLGVDGEAITEEQAGEELIKATTQNNIEGLDPAGINLLVQSGAPVNYQDMWKRTPLHYAARDGHLLVAKRLVELGGDLTAQDFLGRTPLHMAARKGHADAVVLLGQLGSDLNHPDNNPWPNNTPLTVSLAEGRTPMHWACYKGHAEVVHKLCELGANKEALDAMRRTPLHWAARRGHTDCVQVLLVMGANVNAVDTKSMKPINLANSKESNQQTQQLLHKATIRKQLPPSLPVFAQAPARPSLPPISPARKAAGAGTYNQLSDSDDEGTEQEALSLQQAVAKARTRLRPAAPPVEEEDEVVDGVYDDDEEEEAGGYDDGVYDEEEEENAGVEEEVVVASEEEEEYVEEEEEEEEAAEEEEEEEEEEVAQDSDDEVVAAEEAEEAPAQDASFAEALAKAKALYEQQQENVAGDAGGKVMKAPKGAQDDGIRFVREGGAGWEEDEEDGGGGDDDDDVEFA